MHFLPLSSLLRAPFETIKNHGASINREKVLEDVGLFFVPHPSRGDNFWANKARDLFAGLFGYLLVRSEHVDAPYTFALPDARVAQDPSLEGLFEHVFLHLKNLEAQERRVGIKRILADMDMLHTTGRIDSRFFLTEKQKLTAFFNSPEKTADSILDALESEFLEMLDSSIPA